MFASNAPLLNTEKVSPAKSRSSTVSCALWPAPTLNVKVRSAPLSSIQRSGVASGASSESTANGCQALSLAMVTVSARAGAVAIAVASASAAAKRFRFMRIP